MKKIVPLLLLLLLPLWSFAQLVSVSSFGSNPGALNMFRYSPDGVPANAPLVVVLHGCTQTAATYATETEWNKLADQYKFHVVYPEQRTGNNSSRCFNWFENGDITRGQGEALSVKQMVDFMKSNFSIDNNRVFVTGLSAGGAMTAVMCATYPEVFAAGAPMAGVPYRAGVGTSAAFSAMSPGVDRTPQQWGDLVRQQNPSYTGAFPKMAVFHGSIDNTVRPMNMVELAEQWTNVNGADATIDITNTNFDGVNNITRRVYNDAGGGPSVITYEMIGMGHAISVNPGTGNPKQGGQTGSYSVNRGFWSGYWAADFFGLFAPATPPAAPSNLTAAAVSDVQINLTWADNSDNETNFVVERALSSGGTYTVVATLPANSTAFSNTGLSASTSYFYRVRAVNGAGNSAFSNTASATTGAPDLSTPNAPSTLTASAASSSQINLTWTDNSGNETGFTLERSLSAGSGFSTVATLPANSTTYNDTGLSLNTTYYYRVRAQNANGNSAFSNTASATTLNQVVSNYTISQPNGTFYITTLSTDNTGQSFTAQSAGDLLSISVRLNAAVSNATLRIFAGNSVSGTPVYTQSGVAAGSGWQTVTLSTPFAAAANTQYTFQLVGASIAYTSSNAYAGGHFWYNALAYTSFDAAFELLFQTIEDGGSNPPPATVNAPSALTASAVSSSQINLTWTDNSSNEDNFTVERSTSATTGFAVIATLPANTTAYSSMGLNENTVYYYRVKASNSSTSSAYSNAANATTQQAPFSAPAAPSGLTASAVSSSQINLTWTDNSNNEDNFTVERSTSATTGFAVIATLPANTTAYSSTGLSASTTYYYRVRAVNTGGNSAYSNTANTSTQQVQTSTYTIAQPNGTFYLSTLNNVNTGQSITTVGAGQITQVKFRLYSAISNSTLRIYTGNTVSGTPAYSQSVSTSAGGWQTFTLSTPFAVAANTQYTVILTNASVAYTNSNAYAGGHLWYNTIAYTSFDAAFEIVVQSSGGSVFNEGEIVERGMTRSLEPGSEGTPELDIMVYPNPCTEQLGFKGLGQEEYFEVRLFDATGKKVYEGILSQDDLMDMRGYQRGVYHLKINALGQNYDETVLLK